MLPGDDQRSSRQSRTSYHDYAGQLKMATDQAIYLRKSQQNATDIKVKKSEVNYSKTKKRTSRKSKKEPTAELKRELVMHEHMEDVAILLDRLKTNAETGMKQPAYEEAYKRFGPNKMTPPPTTPEWVKFLKEITTGFSLLLWVGGILCFISFGIQRGMSDVYIL